MFSIHISSVGVQHVQAISFTLLHQEGTNDMHSHFVPHQDISKKVYDPRQKPTHLLNQRSVFCSHGSSCLTETNHFVFTWVKEWWYSFTQSDLVHLLLLRLMQEADRCVLTVQKVSLKLKRFCKGRTRRSEMRVLVERNTWTHHRSSHSRSSGSHQSSDRNSLNPLVIRRSFSANHNHKRHGKTQNVP